MRMRIRFCHTAYVAYWPEADMQTAARDDRFLEKSDTGFHEFTAVTAVSASDRQIRTRA